MLVLLVALWEHFKESEWYMCVRVPGCACPLPLSGNLKDETASL